jgi:hypothetical protein
MTSELKKTSPVTALTKMAGRNNGLPWLWAWIEPHGGVTHPISLAKAMEMDWYK